MPRTTSRNEDNAVSRTVYLSLEQDAYAKEVARKSFGGNLSAAMVSRFMDAENVFDIPAYLKPRVAAAAKAAGLSMRDYVIKVFTQHALELPPTKEEKAQEREAASR